MNLSKKAAATTANTTKNSGDASSDNQFIYSQAFQDAVAKSRSIVAAEATRRTAEAEAAIEV